MLTRKPAAVELSVRAFASRAALRSWLLTNQATSPGIWVRIFKKASGVPSVTFAEVLDEGLCFGWSESLRRPGDTESYLQRFTPRQPKGAWASKRNREHVARLTREQRMMPSGLGAVAAAKRVGRWNALSSRDALDRSRGDS